MNVVTFTMLMVVGLAADSLAETECKDVKPVKIAANDLSDKFTYHLYGSLYTQDKGTDITYSIDTKNPETHGFFNRTNGTKTEIEIYILPYRDLVAYIDLTHNDPMIVQVLFFNKGDEPSFCFYKCVGGKTENFEIIKCYGKNKESTKKAIDKYFEEHKLKLDGRKMNMF